MAREQQRDIVFVVVDDKLGPEDRRSIREATEQGKPVLICNKGQVLDKEDNIKVTHLTGPDPFRIIKPARILDVRSNRGNGEDYDRE